MSGFQASSLQRYDWLTSGMSCKRNTPHLTFLPQPNSLEEHPVDSFPPGAVLQGLGTGLFHRRPRGHLWTASGFSDGESAATHACAQTLRDVGMNARGWVPWLGGVVSPFLLCSSHCTYWGLFGVSAATSLLPFTRHGGSQNLRMRTGSHGALRARLFPGSTASWL